MEKDKMQSLKYFTVKEAFATMSDEELTFLRDHLSLMLDTRERTRALDLTEKVWTLANADEEDRAYTVVFKNSDSISIGWTKKFRVYIGEEWIEITPELIIREKSMELTSNVCCKCPGRLCYGCYSRYDFLQRVLEKVELLDGQPVKVFSSTDFPKRTPEWWKPDWREAIMLKFTPVLLNYEQAFGK